MTVIDGSHDDSSSDARRTGFGIGARLYAAFSAATALTLIAVATAWFAFENVRGTLDSVANRAVPVLATSFQLAVASATAAAIAPNIISAPTEAARDAARQEMETTLRSIDAATATLRGLRARDRGRHPAARRKPAGRVVDARRLGAPARDRPRRAVGGGRRGAGHPRRVPGGHQAAGRRGRRQADGGQRRDHHRGLRDHRHAGSHRGRGAAGHPHPVERGPAPARDHGALRPHRFPRGPRRGGADLLPRRHRHAQHHQRPAEIPGRHRPRRDGRPVDELRVRRGVGVRGPQGRVVLGRPVARAVRGRAAAPDRRRPGDRGDRPGLRQRGHAGGQRRPHLADRRQQRPVLQPRGPHHHPGGRGRRRACGPCWKPWPPPTW